MYRIFTLPALALAGLVLLVQSPAPLPAQTQTEEKPAYLNVILPKDAQLLVDGTKTKKTGEERHFVSPPLPLGKPYKYELKATWTENGKQVVRERKARVEAGKTTIVDLLEEESKQPDKTSTTTGSKTDDKTIVAKNTKIDDKPVVAKEAKKDDKPKDDDRTPDVIYVPTPQEVVEKMLELVEVKKGDIVYDLGCGDGRIPVTAAKKYGSQRTKC